MAEDDVKALDKKIEREELALEKLNEQTQALVEGPTGTALVPAQTTAEMARQQLARQRAQALKMQTELQKRTRKVAELQRAKARALESRMQRELEKMERMLAPLKETLEQLDETVWTVNLYLGRDEEMYRLKEGKPAPADEPVVVRQLVLAMDQECAVASEEGGMDSLDQEKFDEWLLADPGHVDQIIPEQKAVVALVPRWNSNPKRYASDEATKAAMEGNEQTYFLIRNGENLFRTWTDFNVGSHLVPKANEFTKYFKRTERVYDADDFSSRKVTKPIEPGTDAWAKAEKRASFRERHFMRVALILEGLLHRTTIFHPLPEADPPISFMDPSSHDAGRVRFVLDGERLLTSGDDLPPFERWLDELTGQLRKGHRIVGNFNGWKFRDANKDDDYYDSGSRRTNTRLWPNNADKPLDNTIYVIEDQEPNGDLIIRYKQRTERYVNDGWDMSGEYRVPKTRARCILRPGDDFIIPLDLADVHTMERYLASRTERHAYTTMFPVLKAAIRAKRAEERVEKPFRELIVAQMMKGAKCDEQTARAHLDDLVRWYKLGNRIHRPLVEGNRKALLAAGIAEEDVDLVVPEGMPPADAGKAVRLIVAEFKRRLKDVDGKVHEDTVAGLRDMHRDALLIARMRNGRYVVLTPEDKRNVHVRERQYTAGGALREDKRWILPGGRVARWTVLYKSERWEKWDLTATAQDHLTGPEREQFIEKARENWERRHAEDDEDARGHAITAKPAAVCWVPQREGHEEVQVWSVGFDWRWSDRRRNTGKREDWTMPEPGRPGMLQGYGPPEPCFHYRQYRWRRKKGELEVYHYDRNQSGWTHKGSYDDAVDEFKDKPWDSDTYNKGREVVWEDDGESMRKYFELRAPYDAWNKSRIEMEKVLARAVDSLEAQYLQEKYDAVWRNFLQDYADPELWHGHVKTIDLPEFDRYRARSHYGEPPAYIRALRSTIERGELPWGKTVREVIELATKDPRFYFAWKMQEKYEPGGRDSKGKGTSWSSGNPVIPVQDRVVDVDEDDFEFELMDLRFEEGLKLVEPWPPEPDDEEIEVCEGCFEPLDDCICEPEPMDDDFDVEGTIEEGIAALPKGSE